jgi:hypothetical protein
MAQNPGGKRRIIAALALVALASLVLVAMLSPGLIRFWPFSLSDFVQIMTPLVLVSLFIERALEVFVASWRGEETDKIEVAIDTTNAQKKAGVAEAEENLMARQLDLARYKAGTRRIAFVAGVLAGLIVSALGIRAIQLFVDPAAFGTLPDWQQRLFSVADVILTGGAIGGGADGLHKLVSVFTNFMDSSAKLAKARGTAGS